MEDRLHKFAKILNLDINNYTKAYNSWKEDRKKAVFKFLGFEDLENEIDTYETFYYYYLSENMESYFQNFNAKGYTKGLKRLVKDYLEDIHEVDWEDFEKKEDTYSEILMDILISNINYELKKKNKIIIGLSIGLKNAIYILVDISNLKKLKECNTNIVIFDTKYLENIYGVIYQLKEEIGALSSYIKKGDYIMELKEKKGVYKSIFDDIHKRNILINYISLEDNKKLKVIL